MTEGDDAFSGDALGLAAMGVEEHGLGATIISLPASTPGAHAVRGRAGNVRSLPVTTSTAALTR
jgi:hypothetical protein